MERIGVRELRQHASRWLARVRAGETFEVTDRGRTVALLTPLTTESVLDRLLAAGEITPATGRLLDIEPLAAEPSSKTPSEILRDLRDAEPW